MEEYILQIEVAVILMSGHTPADLKTLVTLFPIIPVLNGRPSSLINRFFLFLSRELWSYIFHIDGHPSVQRLVQDYLCWTLVIHK